jgi:hypothetical protein
MLFKQQRQLNQWLKLELNVRKKMILYWAVVLISYVSARPMRHDHFIARQQTFTRNIAQLITHIYAARYKCTFGETYRTREQAAIYAASGRGVADSNHCYRLAMDLNLFDKNDKYLHDAAEYRQFGEYWEKLDPFNEWGGRWKNGDANHFEMD